MSEALQVERVQHANASSLKLLWLELTERCNLECTHCYASSSPHKAHGTMETADWLRVIREAAETGCRHVILIGGEPTLHPSFDIIVREARAEGMDVEVYTNLLAVSAAQWSLFRECSVSLATSFYTADPEAHDRVTTRSGSYLRTLANIEKAVALEIPLRVGLIEASDRGDVEATCDLLRSKGVERVGVDHVRGVGRGGSVECTDELCGACTDGRMAVMPDGNVHPCVFSRWLQVGNVRENSISRILAGDRMRRVKDDLDEAFGHRPTMACNPDQITCAPVKCSPGGRCRPDDCQTG